MIATHRTSTSFSGCNGAATQCRAGIASASFHSGFVPTDAIRERPDDAVGPPVTACNPASKRLDDPSRIPLDLHRLRAPYATRIPERCRNHRRRLRPRHLVRISRVDPPDRRRVHPGLARPYTREQ